MRRLYQNTVSTVFSALFALCFLAPQHAVAQDMPVAYSYKQSGVAYNLVKEALKTEIKDTIESYGMPSVAIGRIDLNGDNNPEIVAVLNDETLFCDVNNKCPHFIYAYTTRGLVEIGRFNAVTFTATNTTTENIRDIKVYSSTRPKRFDTYRWAGRGYEKAK